jgi:hypothetical protein
VRRFKQGLLPLSGKLEEISRCPIRYLSASQGSIGPLVAIHFLGLIGFPELGLSVPKSCELRAIVAHVDHVVDHDQVMRRVHRDLHTVADDA